MSFSTAQRPTLRDYIVTVSVAGCAPIMLQAYSTQHVHEKVQKSMPGAVILTCKPRRDGRKSLIGVPASQRSHRKQQPTFVPTVPTLETILVSEDEVVGV